MREAPSLVIVNKLLAQGATVKAYDPVSMEETKRIIGDKIEYAEDVYETAVDADAIILMTEWNEFRIPNYKVLNKLLKGKVMFDGRNIYDPTEMEEKGFIYYGIGRKKV